MLGQSRSGLKSGGGELLPGCRSPVNVAAALRSRFESTQAPYSCLHDRGLLLRRQLGHRAARGVQQTPPQCMSQGYPAANAQSMQIQAGMAGRNAAPTPAQGAQSNTLSPADTVAPMGPAASHMRLWPPASQAVLHTQSRQHHLSVGPSQRPAPACPPPRRQTQSIERLFSTCGCSQRPAQVRPADTVLQKHQPSKPCQRQ
jgi:hypothetical protein